MQKTPIWNLKSLARQDLGAHGRRRSSSKKQEFLSLGGPGNDFTIRPRGVLYYPRLTGGRRTLEGKLHNMNVMCHQSANTFCLQMTALSECPEDRMAKPSPKNLTEGQQQPLAVSPGFWTWLLSRFPREERTTDPAEVLYRSIHITAKCRYNASIRLKRVGTFSFLTATVLSLGLILIPMLQLSGMKLSYPDRILSSLQVFLAVAVLIYSVINGTAHYATRAQSLNEVGDRIKELSRILRTESAAVKAKGTRLELKPINQRYTRISTASENHSRSDYGRAILQSYDLYRITGLPRLWLNIKVALGHFIAYVIPLALILIEIAIVLDILGLTRILKPFSASQ